MSTTIDFTSGQTVNLRMSWDGTKMLPINGSYVNFGPVYALGEYLVQVHKTKLPAAPVAGEELVIAPVIRNGALVVPANSAMTLMRVKGWSNTNPNASSTLVDRNGSLSQYTAISLDFDSSSPIRIGTIGTISTFPGNNPNTAPTFQPDGSVGFQTYVFPSGGQIITAPLCIEAGSTELLIDNIAIA